MVSCVTAARGTGAGEDRGGHHWRCHHPRSHRYVFLIHRSHQVSPATAQPKVSLSGKAQQPIF